MVAIIFFNAGAVFALLAGLMLWWAYDTNDRVHYRVQEMWAQIDETLNPRPQVVPTLAQGVSVPTFAPTPTATATPTASPTVPGPASTTAPPTFTPSPSPATTSLPAQVILTGFKHEYQLFNNCGPASLAMTLSYWGWGGTQKEAAAALKPVQDDKNVSPRELYEYALTQGYDAYIRVNGDLDTLKRFIAAGYPVLVEKGFDCAPGEARCTGWFGHYSVFSGYDDARQVFILQDSFRGPDVKMAYADVMANWRAFNYLYVALFPAGAARDAEVQALLGPALDVTQNYRAALAQAQTEVYNTDGRDAAFAWFNVGTNLSNLQDYAGAAAAFDVARQFGLPYRMLWYQFGPYRSYYYMARYQDVVDLATFAIEAVTNVPGLEEAYYWRGLSYVALGQRAAAITDYRTALERHPGYQPALDALKDLGVTP
jgi:tetratricopeptide (TPR) repeat protein